MRLSNIKKLCFGILLIAGICGLGFSLHAAMRDTFEFDPDEGTNLIKARLVNEGFDLYKQIWSDQPPLFTALLASWFRIFGSGVYSGRILVLLFSILLLWGFYQNIKIRTDILTARIACIFLILSAQFLILSISVMIGLPSLALAMLSLYCATAYSYSGRKTELFLSAILMAFSLLTKFFTVFMLPLILLEIILRKDRDKKASARVLLPGIFWLSDVTLAYSLIIIAYFYPELCLFTGQLFKPHIAKINIPQADFSVILRLLIQDFDLAILAIFGLIMNMRAKKTRHILLPVLWLGMTLLFLTLHRPVWDHYYLLISLPLCWLAAIFFTGSLRKAKKDKKFFYYAALPLIILAAIMLPFKLFDTCFLLSLAGKREENKALELIARSKTNDRWIFTDLPIYAFNNGILVPPETAVLTVKRMPTAELATQVLQKYKPGLILLGRFQSYSPELTSVILADYRKAAAISIQRALINPPLLRQPITSFLPQNKKWPCYYTQDLILYMKKTGRLKNIKIKKEQLLSIPDVGRV